MATPNLTFKFPFQVKPIHEDQPSTAVVIGKRRKQFAFTPVKEVKEQTDFEHRIPLEQWWMNLRPLNRILAKHETIYISEVIRDDEDVHLDIVEEKDEPAKN